MDEYTVNMSEMAPAFIDITKVELSTDGRTTWTEISENGTVYVKGGTVPRYRVTVKNTGDVASDITYVGLYDYGEGGTGTPDLEAYNSNYDFQLDPGAETTVALDYGMCSPQPTFCPVERGHVYKIISAHATNAGDDTFTFTIAEPTGTPTPSLTPTPTPTPDIRAYLECLFPRIFTGDLTPRLDEGAIFYRIRCIIKCLIPSTSTIDRVTYFTRVKEKCTNGIIDMDSMPAVFGHTDENQDKWCNPPIRGRFAGWWSSKKYKDKKVMIGIAIDWPQADLPEETCGNPPKSEECVFFQDWDNTVEWDEIPSAIAEESLEALPIKSITPTPTPPHITGECVFPRIFTPTLTPRLDKGVVFYRVQCIIDKWVLRTI